MKNEMHPYDAARQMLSGMVLPAVAELNRLANHWLEKQLKRHDVSLAEFRIVGALLGEHAGLSQRALAERLGVRPATVSGALPRLERKGLIERIGDPNDARANLVRLRETEKGLDPVISIVVELEKILFAGMSGDERAQLRDSLSAAAKRLASDNGEPP